MPLSASKTIWKIRKKDDNWLDEKKAAQLPIYLPLPPYKSMQNLEQNKKKKNWMKALK